MVSEGGFFEVSSTPLEVTDLTSEHALEVSDLVSDSSNITERNLTEILRVSVTYINVNENIRIICSKVEEYICMNVIQRHRNKSIIK
jgi:hypothetical protein